LIGEMPKQISNMLGLVSLNLSRNNLSGEISFDIGNLSSLESLDLSRNQLCGKIPSSLSEMDFLQIFDLSHNSLYSLSWRIPLERHLDTFDASCFEGNIDLCGKPLEKFFQEMRQCWVLGIQNTLFFILTGRIVHTRKSELRVINFALQQWFY